MKTVNVLILSAIMVSTTTVSVPAIAAGMPDIFTKAFRSCVINVGMGGARSARSPAEAIEAAITACSSLERVQN